MAKVKESKVEKQQRSDAAEQAHRLAHELGLDHDHLHEEGTSHEHGHGHHHQIPRQFLTGWQEPLVIWRQ